MTRNVPLHHQFVSEIILLLGFPCCMRSSFSTCFCCIFPCCSISLVLISLCYLCYFFVPAVQAANSAVMGSVCSPNSGWFTLLIAVEMLVKSLPEVVSHKCPLEAKLVLRSRVLGLGRAASMSRGFSFLPLRGASRAS